MYLTCHQQPTGANDEIKDVVRIPTQRSWEGLDAPPKANVWNNGGDPCSWDSVSSTICAADQREIRNPSEEDQVKAGVPVVFLVFVLLWPQLLL